MPGGVCLIHRRDQPRGRDSSTMSITGVASARLPASQSKIRPMPAARPTPRRSIPIAGQGLSE